MSTRSNISVYDSESKTLTKVYCNYDGYISHVGIMLFDFYNSFKKATNLIKFGAIESIEENIDICKFYSRDHQDDVEFILKDFKVENELEIFSLASGSHASYSYLWLNGEWHAKVDGAWNKLSFYLINYIEEKNILATHAMEKKRLAHNLMNKINKAMVSDIVFFKNQLLIQHPEIENFQVPVLGLKKQQHSTFFIVDVPKIKVHKKLIEDFDFLGYNNKCYLMYNLNKLPEKELALIISHFISGDSVQNRC